MARRPRRASGPWNTRRHIRFGLVVVALLFATACTSATGDDDADDVKPAIIQVTPQSTGQDQPTPVPEGRVENQYDLEVSWCFNQYDFLVESTEETQEITTVVDCRRPHEGEVYATYFHPAGAERPYPGNREIERWANVNCYDGFEEFTGVAFELSELQIGTIRPTEETWTGEGTHREVTCYVYAPDAQLTGPMQGSGI